ncbi:MAG: 3-dehydroquinate synthase [Alteromonadaceae bacterium]|nr:3-dehydroquinate synthase [Alteromonadaceae bacterium]
MHTLTVELGARSYPIIISPDCLKQATISPFVKTNKVVIVTNETIAPLYLSQVENALDGFAVSHIVLPDGEQYKDLTRFEQIQTFLLEQHASRDTTLIALGGGVIGDLTGFAAACFQRGIDFIQMPTTLLSQVDSSVGGKTAVNHPLGKNMIGAFYQPKAVFIDPKTLNTLPAREFAAGMAEVIKYGVIYDGAFFAWLEQNTAALKALDLPTLRYAIERCCAIKAEIVAQDEQERGLRALLNLGHTFGHAIEAEMGYGNWLHGEAVAAGINIASKVAMAHNMVTASDCRRIEALLEAFDLPIVGPEEMNYQTYVKHMAHDKKVQAGNIRYILPTSIGSAIVTDAVDTTILTQILGA